MKRQWTALAVCLLAATPGSAQVNRLEALFSGGQVPLTLKMKDLGNGWRRVRIEPLMPTTGGPAEALSQLAPLMAMSERGPGDVKARGPEGPEAAFGLSMLSSLFGGGQSPTAVYYTRGQVIQVGGQQFLVAYQREQSAGGGLGGFLGMMMGAFAGGLAGDAAAAGVPGAVGQPAGPAPGALPGLTAGVTGETAVHLSLVNLAAVGSLREIRPFDLQREIAEAGVGGGLLPYMMWRTHQGPSARPVPPKPSPKKP